METGTQINREREDIKDLNIKLKLYLPLWQQWDPTRPITHGSVYSKMLAEINWIETETINHGRLRRDRNCESRCFLEMGKYWRLHPRGNHCFPGCVLCATWTGVVCDSCLLPAEPLPWPQTPTRHKWAICFPVCVFCSYLFICLFVYLLIYLLWFSTEPRALNKLSLQRSY